MVEKLKKLGGNEWKKAGFHRVYFDKGDLFRFYGLDYEHYNTGRIACATLNGERISNNECRRVITKFSGCKFWYDVATGQFAYKNLPEDVAEVIIARIQATLA